MAEEQQQQQRQGRQPPRQPSRFITDHDAQGKAVFDTTIPEQVAPQTLDSGDRFYLSYVAAGLPVDMAEGGDLASYRSWQDSPPPGIAVGDSSVMRMVDTPPGAQTPMHRTVSVDYAVVLEGELDLLLDSGESRVVRTGDMVVQRGTMHLWRNRSSTRWARTLFVILDACPLRIAGRTLEEDFDGELPAGVGPSS